MQHSHSKPDGKSSEYSTGRQLRVSGVSYAPKNEQGVVLLFGRLATKLGFCVEHVQVHCPDCIARRKGKLYRIEFEYYASHFEMHRHCPDNVDIIVCWENDWESRGKEFRHLEILDLKSYCGVEPRVFSAGCADAQHGRYLGHRRTQWNVPMAAQVGDLVLIYRSYGESHAIHEAWEVVGPFRYYEKRNKKGYWPGHQPYMKCVTRFKNPITFEGLKRDRKTRELRIVRAKFRNAREISDDWPQLYAKIIELNPKSKKPLQKYCPD